MFSQVHIKERLEIKSQQAPVRSLQGVEEMTPATLELIWDAPDDVTLYAETPCGQGQLSESSPGRKVYTFPGSVAGQYFFRIFYYGCSVFGQPAAPPANITGTLTLGSDTPIVFHGTVQPRSDCMGAPNCFEFTYVHSTPYVSLSDFYLVPDNSFITTAQGTGFSYSAYGGCISTRWYPERDPITLTIVSGSEFGKFAIADGPALDTTVTLLVSELPNVWFIPSGRFAPDGVVTIEVRCLSLVSTCELQVRYCSILLGETKYFYAVEGGGGETRPWMKIYEAVSPELPSGAQVDGVWTVRESGAEPNQGQRLGVYWEQKKPIPNGGTLPIGMVRVVGRYWHPDSIYTVDLIATKRVWWMGSQGTIGYRVPIEVKKPARLHDESVFSKPFKETRNIRNELLDIDALCIEYGGKIGIPPQVIKGQMFQESDKTGDQFNPSYRYEPWADYGFASEELNPKFWKDYRKQPFWVTGQPPRPMGEGKDVPLDHQNVKPVYYPTSPISIADYAINNWGKYWKWNKSGTGIIIIGNDKLTEKWEENRKKYEAAWVFGISPITIAREATQKEIKQKYTDYAQTRKAASYGLIQMLYTTAKDPLGFNRGKSIEESSAPEELNDEKVEMPFYQKFTEKNLREEFGGEDAIVPDSNWPKGWEKTWMDSFKAYNSASDYGISVFNHAKKFYPQKQQGAQ